MAFKHLPIQVHISQTKTHFLVLLQIRNVETTLYICRRHVEMNGPFRSFEFSHHVIGLDNSRDCHAIGLEICLVFESVRCHFSKGFIDETRSAKSAFSKSADYFFVDITKLEYTGFSNRFSFKPKWYNASDGIGDTVHRSSSSV